MSPDDFVIALRALEAPVFLDDQGVPSPAGTEFTATTSDGKNVLVTQLSSTLNGLVTDPDNFVRTLERSGYQGAGITESGQLYFLELPPRGMSLSARLASAGPVPATELLDIARAATSRLADAAAQPHGLITPATVYLAQDGDVSLRWQGLAPALRAAGVEMAAIARELDAESYFAPELRDRGSFDVRTDVFALGTTIYSALTGRPPFGGRTTATVMAVVLADDGAPATRVTNTLTAALLRAIEHDPADRWNDFRQFHDALSALPAEPRRGGAEPAAATRHGCGGTATLVIGGGLVLWAVSQYIS